MSEWAALGIDFLSRLMAENECCIALGFVREWAGPEGYLAALNVIGTEDLYKAADYCDTFGCLMLEESNCGCMAKAEAALPVCKALLEDMVDYYGPPPTGV